MPGRAEANREIVSQGVFFALFRVVEIEELSGPEKAVEWAKAMVEEPQMRQGFSEAVLKGLAERAVPQEPSAGD